MYGSSGGISTEFRRDICVSCARASCAANLRARVTTLARLNVAENRREVYLNERGNVGVVYVLYTCAYARVPARANGWLLRQWFPNHLDPREILNQI